MAKKKVMALGFFDGIHIGHAALMNMIIKRAREYDAEPAVLTFDVHPDSLVFKKNVPLINSADDRERILSRCFGINDVVVVHFNQSVMHMDWKVFINELIDEMNLCWIVVGHDFKFGYKGLGTAEKLKEYCAQRGLECRVEQFSNGRALLKAFSPGKYQILFLDIYMPGYSGMQAAQEIREQDEHCFLAFTTTSEEHALESYGVYAAGYLLKPYSREQLYEVMDWCMEHMPPLSRALNVLSDRENVSLPLREIRYIEVSAMPFREFLLVSGKNGI